MVRRDKTTIFLDATEETKVADLKKKLEGITKKASEDLKLYNITSKEALDDNKSLGDSGYKAHNAKAQDPATIGLAYRNSKCVVSVKQLYFAQCGVYLYLYYKGFVLSIIYLIWSVHHSNYHNSFGHLF